MKKNREVGVSLVQAICQKTFKRNNSFPPLPCALKGIECGMDTYYMHFNVATLKS